MRVGGPVGAAVAEQVEGDDVQALGGERPGERLVHPARHQLAVEQHHPGVAAPYSVYSRRSRAPSSSRKN